MRALEFITENEIRRVTNQATGTVDITLNGEVKASVPFAAPKLLQAFANNPDGLERIIRDKLNSYEVSSAIDNAMHKVRNEVLEKQPISPIEQKYIEKDELLSRLLRGYVDKTLTPEESAAYRAAEHFMKTVSLSQIRDSIKMRRERSLKEDSMPELGTDNPGGKWLDNERKRSASTGVTEFGCPKIFGSVTAYFNHPLLIPVDMLARVPGMCGEQSRVRDESLSYLVDYMGKTGRLPDGMTPGKEHIPFIMVDYSGQPWVNEGNHRIMAAKKLGWKYLPTEVRYFAGGEEHKGPWDPDHLINFTKQLQGKPRS